ncbi:hypothetical protein KL928_001310 [Ogataea angusta]|uniref:Kinetochore protein NUF2 n=1 Tax=Pichia angusta TaxID=870730 RepID=A0AAN6DHW2_PICAN|nr:uncharacterized protein KL928_001310 [Ogataea angusta]KAG7821226.1 hypothetical protein KL928_001310 [Ogataea angusta]
MARPSAIYRSSQPTAIPRTRYKFPILETRELVSLFDTMDFNVSEEMLTKPTPSFMKSLIEQIMDKFLYVSPHSLKQRIQQMENNEDDDQEGLQNSLSVVASQRIMYKFLCDCGVEDFSIRDMAKPEPSRIRIILSALINYARFREERMGDCEQLLVSSENTLSQYKHALKINNSLKSAYEDLTNKILRQGYNEDEIMTKNQQLQNELKALTETQQQLAAARAEYKTQKFGLIRELENQNSLLLECEKELERLTPYIRESPESVKEVIDSLKDSLANEQKHLTELEQRSKNISISIDSFQQLTHEFRNYHRVLEEIQTEFSKQEKSTESIQNMQDEIQRMEVELNDKSRQINHLKKQLNSQKEKLATFKENTRQKLLQLEDKSKELREERAQLMERKSEEDEIIRNKENEAIDWEMQSEKLKKDFEAECKGASYEMNELNSKINFYIDEMANRINQYATESF